MPSLSRRDTYPALIPLLLGLFGAILFIALLGLLWCFLRRKKHRAPIIPYHLHTLAPIKSAGAQTTVFDSGNGTAGAGSGQAAEGENGVEVRVGGGENGAEGTAEERERARKERKVKRPSVLGQEGRGVGYGFNPIFREAYGGGGGRESGVEGGMAAARVGPRWG